MGDLRANVALELPKILHIISYPKNSSYKDNYSKTNPSVSIHIQIYKKMKTGIELIAEERAEQLGKHGRTVEKDVQENQDFQLSIGATRLISRILFFEISDQQPPDGWDYGAYLRMCSKSFKERLVIAGALLAAEIDRLQFIENNTNKQ